MTKLNCLLNRTKQRTGFHESTIESVSRQLQFLHCLIVSEGTIDVYTMAETDEMRDFVPLLFLSLAKTRC